MAPGHLQDRPQLGHPGHVAVPPPAGDDSEGIPFRGLELRLRHRLVAAPHHVGDLVQVLQIVGMKHLVEPPRPDVEDHFLSLVHVGSIGEPDGKGHAIFSLIEMTTAQRSLPGPI